MNSRLSPLGVAEACGFTGAPASSSYSNRILSRLKSRSSIQSPVSSSSTISRNASIPILSTRTLIRARARLARSHSWRSKMRMHASVTFR